MEKCPEKAYLGGSCPEKANLDENCLGKAILGDLTGHGPSPLSKGPERGDPRSVTYQKEGEFAPVQLVLEPVLPRLVYFDPGKNISELDTPVLDPFGPEKVISGLIMSHLDHFGTEKLVLGPKIPNLDRCGPEKGILGLFSGNSDHLGPEKAILVGNRGLQDPPPGGDPRPPWSVVACEIEGCSGFTRIVR